MEFEDKLNFTNIRTLISDFRAWKEAAESAFDAGELDDFICFLKDAVRKEGNARDKKGIATASYALQCAKVFAELIDADHNIMLAMMLYPIAEAGIIDAKEINDRYGEDVESLVTGIKEVSRFSSKNSAHNQDNFRGLMLGLANDIRVIIIMIVRNLVLMRLINHHPDEQWVRNVAFEANCLYAQLAHRLGLYKIKGELEDLSLKYTNREIYTQIAHKLNETKRDRDRYISEFIAPLKQRLLNAGLTFDIKGRTKSISSIWNKIKKQKVDLQGIYDLFAIRVIIDTPREKEKSDCWMAYSILADMYRANPARMKDWISIPKANGYESLHATVMGPDNKWVEVQFRSRRMDLVAEKGLAAHWRYKGVKGDSSDQWMSNVRDILETGEAGPMQLMRDMKLDNYEKEVYAFTPKGDLLRLPAGATVLDFAFLIHSNVGAHCTGAIIDGQHRKINYKFHNGDTIEILTSNTQTPKSEWLNIVVSAKAKNKIKQKLNEVRQRSAELGKELFSRRAKNRKIDIEEAHLMKLIKKSGYKFATEFFADIADEKIDAGKFLNSYISMFCSTEDPEKISAEEFEMHNGQPDADSESDVLVIGEKSLNGLKYRLARCCNPVYGDDVFGFISSDGVVKIHKTDCPNAGNIRRRYPYRIIRADWNGAKRVALPATLRIVGNDDIGIVTNITSIISKEPGTLLRNISIDSNDGLFQGIIVVSINDRQQLADLVKKIKTVKGVKTVTRQ